MTCSLKTQTKQKPTIVSSTIYGLAGGVFLGAVFLCYFCCFLNCHGCEIYEHVMMIVMIVPSFKRFTICTIYSLINTNVSGAFTKEKKHVQTPHRKSTDIPLLPLPKGTAGQSRK